MILTTGAGVCTECGDLDHPLHTGDDTRVEQGTGCTHVNCLKSLEACLAYDSDRIDHEVDSAQSWSPVADMEVVREVGEYKLLMHSSGQRRTAGGNYGVTSAVQRLTKMPPDKTRGTGQQYAHARS